MDEIGKVVGLNGNLAKVELGTSDHCTNCKMASFCLVTGSGKREIMAQDLVGVKIGDVVRVRISGGNQLSSILLVFGLPILFGIIGLFIGANYSDVASLISGAIGLGVGFGILKLVEILFFKKRIPKIVEICQEE